MTHGRPSHDPQQPFPPQQPHPLRQQPFQQAPFQRAPFQRQHFQQAAAQHHAAPARGSVVIDVGADARRAALIGGAVSAGIGLVALIASLTRQVTGGTGAVVTATSIGGVFLLIGLLPLMFWNKLARPRKLVFDQGGVRWDDPKGQPWTVPWQELAAVVISRTKERVVRASDAVARKTMVRLDLHPADPGFRARHPEMEHLWEFHRVRNGYRLPLGSSPKYIPVIEHAMRSFAPGIYQGIRDEGFTVGLV